MDEDLLQRLCDIEAIKQLKARYFRLMDQKRWDDWALVFAKDAHLVVPEGGVDERGRAAVAQFVPQGCRSDDDQLVLKPRRRDVRPKLA